MRIISNILSSRKRAGGSHWLATSKYFKKLVHIL
jgi:hypothetical protein